MGFTYICPWFLVSSLICLSLTFLNSARAEIIPDNTLGHESSVVTPNQTINDISSDIIDGGAIRGVNLFHSFQEFNIDSGRGVYFNNPSGIENILTRVTGTNVSHILGTLGVLGNANLFFINPNGIIFGPNAHLNINGSFIASTANSIKFADGTLFSTRTSESAPLLAISTPIGLQYGKNPGTIQVKGDSQGFAINTTTGLQIQPNQTLALVGGDISLEGATLKTNGGTLELGSVAGEGLVSLSPTSQGFSLDYDGVENFGNIQLSNETNIDTSGIIRGGGIQIQTGNLQISQGSRIASFTAGPISSGDIRVNATDSVEVIGTGRFEQAFAQIIDPTVNPSEFRNGFFGVTVGTGRGANLAINTGKLILRNGAFILVSTFGQARGGNVNVNASKSVELIDSLLATGNRFGSNGDAGNLSLNTQNVTLQDRGLIGSSSFGNGKAGDISITSSDSIDMTGGKTFSELIVGTGINTSISSFTLGISDAGNIDINTNKLTLRDRAQILASTFSSGNAAKLVLNTSSIHVIGSTTQESNNLTTGFGNLANSASTGNAGEVIINTSTLLIENGGQVGTATFGRGNAGNMRLNASDIKIIGINSNDGNPSALSTSSESSFAAGAGNLTINTDILQVRDGGAIVVRSEGLGTAGSLNVNAHSIRLDNKSFLSADTRGISADPNQQQANINLRSQNVIMLRNSNITTNARGENVIGGNININTDFLVAAENSDISANSTDFRGGRVTINAKAVLGSQSRNALTQNNDITATGASPEFTGTVEINTPEVDPSNGLVTLPSNLVDPSQLDNSCRPGSTQSQSSFIATGRGGLPLSATEPLQDTSTLAQWVKPRTAPPNSAKVETEPQASTVITTYPVSPPPIVEASGWVVDAHGTIYLVAQAPEVTPSSLGQTSASCPVR